MTMNLAFESVAPCCPPGSAARLAVPRSTIARAMREATPHVDEARRRDAARGQRSRLDVLLFGVRSTCSR